MRVYAVDGYADTADSYFTKLFQNFRGHLIK